MPFHSEKFIYISSVSRRIFYFSSSIMVSSILVHTQTDYYYLIKDLEKLLRTSSDDKSLHLVFGSKVCSTPSPRRVWLLLPESFRSKLRAENQMFNFHMKNFLLPQEIPEKVTKVSLHPNIFRVFTFRRLYFYSITGCKSFSFRRLSVFYQLSFFCAFVAAENFQFSSKRFLLFVGFLVYLGDHNMTMKCCGNGISMFQL